jgi:hypothetical protein
MPLASLSDTIGPTARQSTASWRVILEGTTKKTPSRPTELTASDDATLGTAKPAPRTSPVCRLHASRKADVDKAVGRDGNPTTMPFVQRSLDAQLATAPSTKPSASVSKTKWALVFLVIALALGYLLLLNRAATFRTEAQRHR